VLRSNDTYSERISPKAIIILSHDLFNNSSLQATVSCLPSKIAFHTRFFLVNVIFQKQSRKTTFIIIVLS